MTLDNLRKVYKNRTLDKESQFCYDIRMEDLTKKMIAKAVFNKIMSNKTVFDICPINDARRVLELDRENPDEIVLQALHCWTWKSIPKELDVESILRRILDLPEPEKVSLFSRRIKR